MDLPTLISTLGIPAVAKRYGVTERAVLDWKYIIKRPRPDKAREIAEREGMSVAEVYPPKKPKRRKSA